MKATSFLIEPKTEDNTTSGLEPRLEQGLDRRPIVINQRVGKPYLGMAYKMPIKPLLSSELPRPQTRSPVNVVISETAGSFRNNMTNRRSSRSTGGASIRPRYQG